MRIQQIRSDNSEKSFMELLMAKNERKKESDWDKRVEAYFQAERDK